MLYSTFSGRPLQSQSEAPLQLQSQSEAPLQQTLTSTSGHGTVPSLDRACQSQSEAPLQLQSQSEAPLQQTLTSTSGHGTVPSLDRACNSKAWTIRVTCRESAPGSPGADSSSWATGFKIKLPFEQV